MAPAVARERAPVAPARRCAHAVLRRVFERGAYADEALRAEARELQPRDRALAMRLAFGAVQRRDTLDHLVGRFSERPPGRLDGPVIASLRLGLYELLYLAGAPDRAVVADAVELAKGQGRGGHGLVNAVLRRAIREDAAGLLERLPEDTPAQAALRHSHPRVARGAVVGATRGRAGPQADGRRQRARRACPAGQHARHGHRRARP